MVEKRDVVVASVVVERVMLSKMLAPVYVPLNPKLNPMAPDDELYVIGSVPDRELDEILLLKTDQSEASRHPKTEDEAVSQVTVLVERVRPVLKVNGTS